MNNQSPQALQTLGELRDELLDNRLVATPSRFKVMLHLFEVAVRDAAFEEVQQLTGKRGQA